MDIRAWLNTNESKTSTMLIHHLSKRGKCSISASVPPLSLYTQKLAVVSDIPPADASSGTNYSYSDDLEVDYTKEIELKNDQAV